MNWKDKGEKLRKYLFEYEQHIEKRRKKKSRQPTGCANAHNLEIEKIPRVNLIFLQQKYAFWLSHVVQPCECTSPSDI